MANSDAGRATLRPFGVLSSQMIQPETLPFESEPPQEGMASEDFLYHLSRGSELLKENRVEPAKEALEIALSLQPQDVRGQGLLGVVYFRLGLYPRAIDIYKTIVFACPNEIAPKVNLALCYVKTGQHAAARDLLEDVVRREPGHLRAWSYLGLVFHFLRDFVKAHAAFERAGQQAMAERMLRYAEQAEPELGEILGPERLELRAAAHDACAELENKTSPFCGVESISGQSVERTGKWRATEPGEEVIPEVDRLPRRPSTPPPSFRPPPLPSLISSETTSGTRMLDVRRALGDVTTETDKPELRDWLTEHVPSTYSTMASLIDERSLLVDLDEPFAVRATAVVFVTPPEVARREMRLVVRARSRELESEAPPLGGGRSPIVGYRGPGRLLARCEHERLELFELVDETVTVRQSALFGLTLGLRYETERRQFSGDESLELVRISGKGLVSLALSEKARVVEVTSSGLVVRRSAVIGWTARVLPQVIDPAESPGRTRGYLFLSGDGTVFLG